LSSFMCAPTDEEAVHRSRNGPGFFSYSLGYYYNPATGSRHQPGRTNIYRQFMSLPQSERDGRETLRQARLMTREEIAQKEPEDEVQRALFRAARSGQAIGAPDTIRKNIKKYEDQNLDVLILTAQSGDRKHEDIMEAIDLFGRKVLPDFHETHEVKHKKWRERQLDGVKFPVNSSV